MSKGVSSRERVRLTTAGKNAEAIKPTYLHRKRTTWPTWRIHLSLWEGNTKGPPTKRNKNGKGGGPIDEATRQNIDVTAISFPHSEDGAVDGRDGMCERLSKVLRDSSLRVENDQRSTLKGGKWDDARQKHTA